MLRTSIARIKVCTISCVPRLLREDQRCIPGKHDILSYAVVSKVQKSTNPSDDDEFEHKKEKHKDGCEYFIIPGKKPNLQTDKCESEKCLDEDKLKDNNSPLVPPKATLTEEAHNEKLQRFMDEAFSREHLEAIKGERYFSHSVHKIEEARRVIEEMAKLKMSDESNLNKPVPDERIQLGTFLRRDIIKEDPSDEISELDEFILLAPDKKKDVKKSQTAEQMDLLPYTLNIHTYSKGKDYITKKVDNEHETDEQCMATTQNTKNENAIETPAMVPKKRSMQYLYISQNKDTDDALPLKANVTTRKIDKYVKNEENNDDNLNWIHQCGNINTVHATTVKENEEQLTQKVEHIDETPLVEAQKQPIEGLNVTPKVLGDIDHTINCFCDKSVENNQIGASRVDVPASYDEVAKRCLDTPTSQIDEILLREMEKLGIPITNNRDSRTHSPVLDDDLVQMDVLKKQQKRPVEKNDLDLESHEYERGAVDLCSVKQKYCSSYVSKENEFPETVATSDDLQYELSNENDKEADGFESSQNFTEPPLGPKIRPNQVIIDPYDKKSIAYDTGEYDPNEEYDPTQKYSYFFIPIRKQLQETDTISTSAIKKTNIKEADYVWGTEPLDTEPVAKHIQNSWPKRMDATYSPIPPERNISNGIHDNRPGSRQSQANRSQCYGSKENDLFSFNLPNVPDDIRNDNQLHPKPAVKQGQKTYTTGIDVPSSFEKQHLCVSEDMWRKKMVNTTKPDDKLAQGIDTNVSSNRTNLKVSDDIWDSDLDYELGESKAHETCEKSSDVASSIKQTKLSASAGVEDNHPLNPPSKQAQETFAEYPKANEINSTPFYVPNIRESDSKQDMNQLHSRPIVKQPQKTYTIGIDTPSQFDQPNQKKVVLDDIWNQNFNPHDEKQLERGSGSTKMDPVSNFVHPDSTLNSSSKSATAAISKSIPAALNSLPKLDENVSLSELLRRVRQRSRMLECKNDLKSIRFGVDSVQEKCDGKSPCCLPLAPRSPPNNPILPPSLGLPPLKPSPPACQTIKSPRNKCNSCDLDMSSGLQMGPKINAEISLPYPQITCEMNVDGTAEVNAGSERLSADLTEEIIYSLTSLGKIIGGAMLQGKKELLEAGALVKNRRGSNVLLAKDYEPWIPIPSWPYQKKAAHKQRPCTPGCKVYPPPRSAHDPPCNQKPCIGFPKKTFTTLDCFAVSLGNHKVGDF